MSSIVLQAGPSHGGSIFPFILLCIILLFVLRKLSWVWIYRIAFYISRQNGMPGSPFAVYSLLMLLKSAFKKELKKETYWNIVHEIANRYHCSFLLYDREFSFTVIADSLSNLDFEDLDMEGIEELNQR